MDSVARFIDLVGEPSPPLDRAALALAAGAEPALDEARWLAELDRLATGVDGLDALVHRLFVQERFAGNNEDYYDPRNSLLPHVLTRRLGIPITLAVVCIEVGRRAGIALHGVGMPGHFVVAHFGADPPIVIDPHSGGRPLPRALEPSLVRPWSAHEIAMRMLNNLVHAYTRALDVGSAIHAARLRLLLPAARAHRTALTQELRALEARLN